LPTRDFPIVPNCLIPPEAKAVAARLATTNSFQVGYLMIGPANGPAGSALPPPLVATLNYAAGSVAAGAATLELGEFGIRVFSIEDTDLIIDIVGYYTKLPQPPIRVTPVGAISGGVQQTSTVDWDGLNNLCGTQGVNDVPITFTNGETHTPPLGTGSFDADLFSSLSGRAEPGSNRMPSTSARSVTSPGCATPPAKTCSTPHTSPSTSTRRAAPPRQDALLLPGEQPGARQHPWGRHLADVGPMAGNWSIDGVAASTVQYSNDFSATIGDWAAVPTSTGTVTLVGDGTATETGNATRSGVGTASSSPRTATRRAWTSTSTPRSPGSGTSVRRSIATRAVSDRRVRHDQRSWVPLERLCFQRRDDGDGPMERLCHQ